MRQRINRLRRIIRVQEQLQRAAEWALHDLAREAAALQKQEESILDALGRDSALLLGLAPALTGRLSELKRRSDDVQLAHGHQTADVVKQRRRRMQARKMEHHLCTKLKRAEETALLDEIFGGGRQTRSASSN